MIKIDKSLFKNHYLGNFVGTEEKVLILLECLYEDQLEQIIVELKNKAYNSRGDDKYKYLEILNEVINFTHDS